MMMPRLLLPAAEVPPKPVMDTLPVPVDLICALLLVTKTPRLLDDAPEPPPVPNKVTLPLTEERTAPTTTGIPRLLLPVVPVPAVPVTCRLPAPPAATTVPAPAK